MDDITISRGNIMVQCKEGSNHVLPYLYFVVDRVNDFSINVSPIILGRHRGDRHIRFDVQSYKLRLNLKTLLYEYREAHDVCRFKRFDLNIHYLSLEGHELDPFHIFGTSPD
jgi:hypothetical protein